MGVSVDVDAGVCERVRVVLRWSLGLVGTCQAAIRHQIGSKNADETTPEPAMIFTYLHLTLPITAAPSSRGDLDSGFFRNTDLFSVSPLSAPWQEGHGVVLSWLSTLYTSASDGPGSRRGTSCAGAGAGAGLADYGPLVERSGPILF